MAEQKKDPKKDKEKKKKPPQPDTEAVIKRDESKLGKFEDFLTSDFMPLVERAWLKDFPFDAGRFVQITLGLMQRTPAVLYCEPLSLIGALLQCAEYALYPDAIRGHCWIIPRYDWKIGMDRANFQIGYKGAIVLFRRSGMAADHAVDSADVYKTEVESFVVEKGLNPKLVHVPWYALKPKPAEEPGELHGTYAICHYRNDDPSFEFVPIKMLDEIRDQYAGKPGDKSKPPGPDTPWFQSEISASWMRRKTAMFQTLKLSPALDDQTMSRLIAQDEKLDAGVDQELQHMLSGQQRALASKLVESAGTVSVGEPVSTNEMRKGALDALMEKRQKEKGDKPAAAAKQEPKGKDAKPAAKEATAGDEPPPVGELAEPPKEEAAKQEPKTEPQKPEPEAKAPEEKAEKKEPEPDQAEDEWSDFMKGDGGPGPQAK